MWTWIAGIAVSLLVIWGSLVLLLWWAKPGELSLKEALRILPDTLRLLRDLTRDAELPRSARVKLVLLWIYLAIPFDPIPDFIPVLGYADEAILVVWVLRSIVNGAGPGVLERHWKGSREGLAALSSVVVAKRR
jgi:uncharacterized membrane protein YkvA (DUF1232 family)